METRAGRERENPGEREVSTATSIQSFLMRNFKVNLKKESFLITFLCISVGPNFTN